MGIRVSLTMQSRNAKTGPIPVSTTSENSCPSICPFKGSGCYAESGPLAIHWRRLSKDDQAGLSWEEFCTKVKKDISPTQLWRMNQAGDLPAMSIRTDLIDPDLLFQLVDANKGKRGFTYTHHNMGAGVNADVVRLSNQQGFTINLSADNLSHADSLAALGCAPVVTVLPSDQLTNTQTPQGRKVIVCPAVIRDDVTCKSCGLCAIANRGAIIGFPAHGAGKRKASAIVNGAA
ncbi:hypothetical protein UFOVP59_59 [uncultured Caudovirales phage]|uniref:DUF7227 domain-containing protein n=1 Tax=uncultured Caudovirales phage TaxID=2100421 RepID=A0A6J5KR79_9CAUD|nr:hypothetical protein UFOVP59_59 [uncultured Caudovirales phage]CAB5220916.1 hypothetical protein UFOVP246_56 [uncultured Caudovirales phage]